MKIMKLFREDIPLVCKGGTSLLIQEVTKELDDAELQNCVVYVRYGPMFLQRIRVDNEVVFRPEVQQMLFDETFWEHEGIIRSN